MNNLEMAKDYLSKARRRQREASVALREGDYSMCVRNSQECLELAAKSLLRFFAIEYPKEHDVGDALERIKHLLTGKLVERLKEISGLMTELAQSRGLALYGDEARGIPSSQLFSRDYASSVLNQVTETLGLIEELVYGP